jgi:hypothetical protein
MLLKRAKEIVSLLLIKTRHKNALQKRVTKTIAERTGIHDKRSG